MIKLILEDGSIKEVPAKLSELSIDKFTQLTLSLGKKYESSIDETIDIIHIISGLDKETIELLDLNQIIDIRTNLMVGEENEVILDKIIIDDIEFNAKLRDGKVSLTLGHIKKIEAYLKSGKEDYVSFLAAIIFTNDSTTIEERQELFRHKMMTNIIYPYFIELNKQFSLINGK